MSKKFQVANGTLNTVEKVTEALLSGSHEVSQFPKLFGQLSSDGKRVVQHIVDQVRPLQSRVRQLEIQLDNAKTGVTVRSKNKRKW